MPHKAVAEVSKMRCQFEDATAECNLAVELQGDEHHVLDACQRLCTQLGLALRFWPGRCVH